MQKFTYRLHLTKTGRLRFLSHHDLMRVLERAIRRSGVPVEYSEGFNPRPRISYHTALAVGIESNDEPVDIELGVWKPPLEVQRAIADQLPEGLSLVACEPVRIGSQDKIDTTSYEITFNPLAGRNGPGEGESPQARAVAPPLQADIDRLLASREAFVTRVNPKSKRRINIRPYIADIRFLDTTRLLLVLRVTPEGTARPEEVLSLLGLPSLPPGVAWQIVKTRTTFHAPRDDRRHRPARRRLQR